MEQRSGKIDVLDLETAGLPATQSSAVQEQQEHALRVRVDVGTRAGRRRHRCEKPLQLGLGIDVGRVESGATLALPARHG